ncbi:hypothetical protein ACLX1H_008860 [Fusarium chlamydosporum]
MSTYTAVTQQGPSDLESLAENGFQLQVALSVAGSDANPSFNVVYQSPPLAPNMNVSWTTNYGLNWTTEPVRPGTQVIYAGNWQSCGLGESYNLDNVGDWVPEQNNPNANPKALNVGKSGYGTGVNIVVGVQDVMGRWRPIWVSPDQLLQGGGGQYEPLQTVQLWYQQGQNEGTIVSSQETPIERFDYNTIAASNNNTEYFSYDIQAGQWEEPQSFPFRNLN